MQLEQHYIQKVGNGLFLLFIQRIPFIKDKLLLIGKDHFIVVRIRKKFR